MEDATVTWVKDNFPRWDAFCESDETKLKTGMQNALLELNEYIEVTEDDLINTKIGRHFLIIAKKNCFNFKHGDREFDRDPQIIVDYNRTINLLTELSSTHSLTDDESETSDITMSSKTKLFDTWFTNLREEDYS